NGANTYTGGTTIGPTTAGGGTIGGGVVQLGVSTVGNPGAIVSGPFGTGAVNMNVTASANSSTVVIPVLVPLGADRTIANAITMTGGFQAANTTGTTFNLSLTGPIALGTTGQAIT